MPLSAGPPGQVNVVPRRLTVPRVTGIAHNWLPADDTRIGNGTPEDSPPGCKRRDPLVPVSLIWGNQQGWSHYPADGPARPGHRYPADGSRRSRHDGLAHGSRRPGHSHAADASKPVMPRADRRTDVSPGPAAGRQAGLAAPAGNRSRHRVPVVARALTAPGMVNRMELPHSFWLAGVAFLLTMALAICPRSSRCPRAWATSLPVSLRRWSHAGSRRARAAARPCGSTRSA